MTYTWFTISVSIVWIVSAMFDYAYFVYYLQLKEYRFDRFSDFLRTPAGKTFLSDYRFLWRMVIVVALYTLAKGVIDVMYIIGAIMVLELVSKGYHVVQRNIRRPVPTGKAVLIIGSALFLEVFLFAYTHAPNIMLLILVFRAFAVVCVTGIVTIPSFATKRLIIFLAKKKMEQYPQLQRIGITGSYGKSSTKEILAQLLASSLRTVATPKNVNTETGVAKFILRTSFDNVEVFVVEMGAYTVGEIKAICTIVKPTIGILTAIAPQHLSLFGSMEHIQKAKYELLYALPATGVAITNTDNAYCRELLPTLSCTVKTYGSDDEYHPDVRITDASYKEGAGVFTFECHGDAHTIRVPLIGRHMIFNIIPAILAAKAVGVDEKTLLKTVETLTSGHGSIRIVQYGASLIIDDSYNANPEGFKAALEVLNSFGSDRRRIVLTRGILELGEKSVDIHEQLGGEISFVADELVITSKDVAAALSRGVVQKYHTQIHTLFAPAEVVDYLQKWKEQPAVILVANKVHVSVAQELGISRR